MVLEELVEHKGAWQLMMRWQSAHGFVKSLAMYSSWFTYWRTGTAGMSYEFSFVHPSVFSFVTLFSQN